MRLVSFPGLPLQGPACAYRPVLAQAVT